MKTTTQNLAAKSTLARLMAAEDLQVNIDQSAPTASFNLVDRTLTLPLWDVGGEAYNMLVGHEVSHALYTPAGTALAEACESISKKHSGVARDYINVVEDARIERLIKTDYPGLRKSFAEGYREFIKRDLFKVNGKDISGLPLIDRINLHYKIGWVKSVPFSSEELPLVRRVAETRTWAEVVALSKELFEFAKKQEEEEKQGTEPQTGEMESPEQEQGEEEGEGSSGSGSEPSDEEGDEEGEGQGSSRSENESDEESEGSNEGEEESEEGGEEDAEGQGQSSSGSTGDEQSSTDDAPSGSATQKALEEGLSQLAPQATYSTTRTFEFPKVGENMVIPMNRVHEVLSQIIGNRAETFYGLWKTSEAANVQALHTEFERRKAADAHRRAMTHDTGVLDPMRLAYYKVSDDIFLSNTTVRDGKNHGLVLLLDMSGSMSDKFSDTMIQVVNLAAFARRANLPFTVYGFVSEMHPTRSLYTGPTNFKGKGWGDRWCIPTWDKNQNSLDFRLLTLLESGMSQAKFQSAVSNLIWASMAYSGSVPSAFSQFHHKAIGTRYDLHSAGFNLSSTPTNQALLALLDLVPQFKAKNRLQVVNVVVLTDGEATDNPCRNFGVDDGKKEVYGILRDPITRREYEFFERGKKDGKLTQYCTEPRSTQRTLAQVFRDRGVNIMSITLQANGRRSSVGNMMTVMGMSTVKNPDEVARLQKTYNAEGWVMLDNPTWGYSKVAVLSVGEDRSVDTFEQITQTDITSKRSLSALNKAWVKSLDKKRTNRPLMAKIAEVVSKNLS